MIRKVKFRNFKALREVAFDLEQLTVLVGPNASGKTTVLEGLHSQFGPAILLRLDAGRLAEACYSDEEVPWMDADGYGLPSVLAYLASEHPKSFQEILKAVRSVVPSFRDMRFPRPKISIDRDREYWGNSLAAMIARSSRQIRLLRTSLPRWLFPVTAQRRCWRSLSVTASLPGLSTR